MTTTKHPEIERAVLEFITESRENGERFTGSTIQAIALETAAKLGFDDFSGSNGWLFSFFRRNNISIKELNSGGESTNTRRKGATTTVEESFASEMNIDESTNDIKEEFIYSETIENEEEYVVINWRDWCRVCGGTETLPEVEQDILEIVAKLLNVRIHTSFCHGSQLF
jgi:hypothetical protein